jgi:hypothetical protein
MSSVEVEKHYFKVDYVAKIRSFEVAERINENFQISIAEEEIFVPDRATFNIKQERNHCGHEMKF